MRAECVHAWKRQQPDATHNSSYDFLVQCIKPNHNAPPVSSKVTSEKTSEQPAGKVAIFKPKAQTKTSFTGAYI